MTATNQAGAAVLPAAINGQTVTWDVGPVPAGVVLPSHFHHVENRGRFGGEHALDAHGHDCDDRGRVGPEQQPAEVGSVICDMAGSTKQVHAGWAMPGDVLTYTLQLQYQHRAGEPNQRWVELTDTLPFSHQARFLGWVGSITGTQHTSQALQWAGPGARR